MHAAGKAAEATRVMTDIKIQIMGIRECRWTSTNQVVYLIRARQFYTHLHGVAMMMDSVAKKGVDGEVTNK